MKYAHDSMIVTVAPEEFKKIQNRLKFYDDQFKAATTKDTEFAKLRDSQVVWIPSDDELYNIINPILPEVNKRAGWNLKIDQVELFQYTKYEKGGFYNWHCDQHSGKLIDGKCRKISFTLWVNDEYTGGELDLETKRPDDSPRYHSFKPKVGKAIFFLGTTWHRVRIIKSGTRKSLVGWYGGPPYV